ncbi:MAG: SDR family oxidoreductase [Candidatus Micrarchaeia archaeon]
MKIFITGGNGLLGSALSLGLVKEHKVVCGCHASYIKIKNDNFSSEIFDITREDMLEVVVRASPDVIIHAAAITDLELCERDPTMAYKVNVAGTENILKAARKCGAKLVYMCTDYIFDGRAGNYSETDKPNPLSVYAKTKLEGEEIIRKDYDNFLSIRTSLHGWNPNPGKTSFSSWVVESLRRGKKVQLIRDQISSMIFTNDLAGIMNRMLKQDLTGIYNVASSDSMSKYDIGLTIAEVFKLNKEFITQISLSQLARKISLKAKRPMNVSLDVSKIEKKLGERMPSIREGIVSMKEKEEEFRNGVLVWR